jgi:hypothetical protein
MGVFTLGYRYDPLKVRGLVGAVDGEAGIAGFVVRDLTCTVVPVKGIKYIDSAIKGVKCDLRTII